MKTEAYDSGGLVNKLVGWKGNKTMDAYYF